MRGLVATVIALGLTPLPHAAAQSQPSAAVTAQLAAGEESEALRALRTDERRLFGEEAPEGEEPGLLIGELPAAATTDVPTHEASAEGARDLSWLEGMTLPDLPMRWDDRVVRYLEYFRDDRRGHRLMEAWLRRSSRYGPLIDRVLERRHLPRDLRCVAMAESGFDPTVRSNRGAAGMWQFVRRTGEEYGLSSDHWVDMRLDPEASTDAAARYLEQLRRRFGTWELALAAYNMGYGALLTAIRRFNTNDYWTLAHLEAGLPFETTLYVAKILACSVVMRNPERFGYGDLSRDPPMDLVRVSVPGGLSTRLLARAAGVDRDTLAALNPALLRSRTPPGVDSWALRVPRDRAESFAERLRRMSPRHPANRTYTARFGETLRDVARRFRTTERALRTLNELEDGQSLRAGFALLVPDVEPRPRPEAEQAVIAVPAGSFEVPGKRRVFYRATGRESAPEIADFFGMTLEDLHSANAIDPSARLQRGQLLQLFVAPDFDLGRAVVMSPDEVRVLTLGSEEFFEWQQEQAGRVRFRYVVAPGDTLSTIGRRFGLSTGSLARINRFSRRTTLHPGDEILIYAARDRVPARYLPGTRTAERDRNAATVADSAAGTSGQEAATQDDTDDEAASEEQGASTSDEDDEVGDEGHGDDTSPSSDDTRDDARPSPEGADSTSAAGEGTATD